MEKTGVHRRRRSAASAHQRVLWESQLARLSQKVFLLGLPIRQAIPDQLYGDLAYIIMCRGFGFDMEQPDILLFSMPIDIDHGPNHNRVAMIQS